MLMLMILELCHISMSHVSCFMSQRVFNQKKFQYFEKILMSAKKILNKIIEVFIKNLTLRIPSYLF